MHENDIFIHKNDISTQENENSVRKFHRKLGCSLFHAWNSYQWKFLANIFIFMHGNDIIKHGFFIFMHENELAS